MRRSEFSGQSDCSRQTCACSLQAFNDCLSLLYNICNRFWWLTEAKLSLLQAWQDRFYTQRNWSDRDRAFQHASLRFMSYLDMLILSPRSFHMISYFTYCVRQTAWTMRLAAKLRPWHQVSIKIQEYFIWFIQEFEVNYLKSRSRINPELWPHHCTNVKANCRKSGKCLPNKAIDLICLTRWKRKLISFEEEIMVRKQQILQHFYLARSSALLRLSYSMKIMHFNRLIYTRIRSLTLDRVSCIGLNRSTD